MRNFRDLKVWQQAHQLVLSVYRETTAFPPDERFGLTVQIRRAAVSIPANLAEGSAKDSNEDFRRFLQIAIGSAGELDYELELAHALQYLSDTAYSSLTEQLTALRRQLTSLNNTVKTQIETARAQPRPPKPNPQDPKPTS